jgi:cell cycle arrest protein BUB3
MAHRYVYVYALASLAAASSTSGPLKPDQERESALKFLTRSVAMTSDGKGWVAGSIEGRISVEYVDRDPEVQSKKYAFRAHRATVGGVDQVYPINAIAYHPM